MIYSAVSKTMMTKGNNATANTFAACVLLFLIVISVSGQGATRDSVRAKADIGWTDFFPDFPSVRFGMSYSNARIAVEKTVGRPVGLKSFKNELVWDGTFAGMQGRATMLFKKPSGAWEIAIVIFAMDNQRSLFDEWTKKIEARHGPSKERDDNDVAVSNVWRLKNGVALEIRMPKDPNSPVVDIHWVKD